MKEQTESKQISKEQFDRAYKEAVKRYDNAFRELAHLYLFNSQV